MRNFSFYINILLPGLLLFLIITALFSGTPSGQTFPADSDITDIYLGTELVILFDRPVDDALRQEFLSHFSSCDIVETLDNYMLVSVTEAASLSDTLVQLRNYPGITAADPNYPLELSSAVSSETVFSDINLDAFAAVSSSNLTAGLALFHNSVTPVREAVIAVADTGIDITHPLLSDFIWTNPGEIPGDGIDNDGNGYIDDLNGWDFYHDDADVCHYEVSDSGLGYHSLETDNDDHGTHVAGIIASVLRGGNLFDTAAASVPVKIMPLKIHGGEKASGSVANAIKAIKYAVMMEADVCNISWGSSAITSSITTLEQTILESDLLFVAAAGNTGSDNDQSPVYPASFRNNNVISVTFVNSYGFLTSKSNFGSCSVDIAAPGTDIYSTIVGDYAYMSGSSMAVPYVSAIAALICAGSDDLYPAAVRELLLSTAYELPYSEIFPLPESMSFAKGKLIIPGIPNLYQALASPELLLHDADAPVLSASTSYTADFIRLHITADDASGSGIRIIKYAPGEKTLLAFRRGTAGTTVSNSGLRFAKPGTYTIYASDYAGNETLLHYYLSEDTTAPVLLPTIHTSPSGRSHRLIAELIEQESEITAVYLASGEYTLENFPKKTALPLSAENNRIHLHLTEPGSYTMYAEDIRGNTSTTVLNFPATEPVPEDSEEPALD